MAQANGTMVRPDNRKLAISGVNTPPPEPVDGAEKSFGEFLHCIVKAKSYRLCEALATDSEGPGLVREKAVRRLAETYKTGWGTEKAASPSLSELTVGTGGALVPYEYAYGLMQDVAEDSIFWPRAFIQPMSSATLLMPLPDPTVTAPNKTPSGSAATPSASSGITNLFAGMVMNFNQTQSAGIQETDPAFRTVELTTSDLAGYLLASNQLVQDYPGLDAFVRSFTSRAVAWWTDQWFFTGGFTANGPQGILQSIAPNGGTLKIARQTAGAVTQADLANMYQKLLPQSKKRAIWAMSPGAMQNISNLTGLGGILYYIPGEDGSQGLLYGRPFYETEKLPDIGTPTPNDGCVLLFDPAMYIIGHRGLFIDYSDQWPVAFTQNQAAFRVVWRGDGQPMLNKAMTLANQSSTQVAPYVCLGDASGN